MNEDFLKILVIISIIVVLIYFTTSAMKNKMLEGLENANTDGSGNILLQSTYNGESGNAANYNTKIKSIVTKMQDTFLINKYRKEYENIIINMDDLIDNLMLKTVLNMQLDQQNPENSIKKLSILNSLNESKSALNNVMKFIDKN